MQRGLVGALGLTPAEDGIVLPHENTIARAVGDRLALYTAVGADLEPIFLVYDGGGAAAQAVAVGGRGGRSAPGRGRPLADGLRHRVWALTDPAVLADVAADLHPRRALIADGHHRYATYLQRQAAQHAAGSGAGPWDLGLCFLVDATAFGPEVHPIHRVVPGLPAGRAGAARVARAWPCAGLDGGVDAALGRAGGGRRAPGRRSCSPPATAASCTCSASPTRRSWPPPCRRSARPPGRRWTSACCTPWSSPRCGGCRTTSTTSATSTTSPTPSPRRRTDRRHRGAAQPDTGRRRRRRRGGRRADAPQVDAVHPQAGARACSSATTGTPPTAEARPATGADGRGGRRPAAAAAATASVRLDGASRRTAERAVAEHGG